MSDGFFKSTTSFLVNVTYLFKLRKANNMQGTARYGLKGKVCLFVCLFVGATASQWVRASSFTRFLDHTQRHTTLGRLPLDK